MFNNKNEKIKEIINKAIRANRPDALTILHERVMEAVKHEESLTDEEVEGVESLAWEMIRNTNIR